MKRPRHLSQAKVRKDMGRVFFMKTWKTPCKFHASFAMAIRTYRLTRATSVRSMRSFPALRGMRCMHAAGPSQQPPAPTASLPPQASQLPPADSQQRRATPISQAKPSQLRRGKQQQPQPSSSHQADSKAQQDGMLYMASQVGQSATPLGTQQPASLAGAGGGVLPAVAVVGGAGAGATPSSVPLVLPEKLNKHKVGRACRTRPPSRKTRMHARSSAG